MTSLTQFVQQFRDAWNASSMSQRALLVGAISLVLVGLGSVVVFSGKADMAVLYAGLSEADAGTVVEALRERSVPYEISESGETIKVPRSRVAETRLTLAQAGLPHGTGIGFELFDRSEFGITDFAQKVNFKRATEGELARTINQMQEVKFSRVQLAMPERRLFGEDQEEASAAVFLYTLPGRSLSRSQVRALQHLVSSSVEGLSPHNITITDQYAHALAAPSDPSDVAALSASQLEVRRAVEKSLEHKVQSMLDRVVGPGHSAVAVTAQMDFDRVERTIETYDPDSQVVRSEQRQTEKSTAGDPGAGGAAGVTANLPTTTNLAAAGGGGGSSTKSDSTITNYEIDTTLERIVQAPGTLKAVSVSVVVDGTYTGAEDGEKTYQPRSDEEMAKFRTLVAAAVGQETAATVEVLNVPLDTTLAEADVLAAAQAQRQQWIDTGITVAKIAGIILLAGYAFSIVRQMVANLARTTRARAAAAGAGEVGARLDMMAGMPTEAEIREEQLKTMSAERPDDMATLIKSWLSER